MPRGQSLKDYVCAKGSNGFRDISSPSGLQEKET